VKASLHGDRNVTMNTHRIYSAVSACSSGDESFHNDSDVDVESDGSACVYKAHGNRLKRIVLGFLPVGW